MSELRAAVHQPASDEQARSVALRYFDCLNNERWSEIATLFAEDAELRAAGQDPRFGRASCARYFEEAISAYPEHVDEPVLVRVGEGRVTVDVEFVGRIKNGQELRFRATDVFDIDDRGLITRLASWFDSHRVRAAVLAARAASGPAAGEVDTRGTVAHATPLRLRAASALIRRGLSFRLDPPSGDGATWFQLADGARSVVAPSVIVSVADVDPSTDLCHAVRAAVAEDVPAPAGWGVLVHTGGSRPPTDDEFATLGRWAIDAAVAFVATDRAWTGAADPGLAIGQNWRLDELARDTADHDTSVGLLTSAPGTGSPRRANPIVLR